MRATPFGNRRIKLSQQTTRNLAYEPFKEDFEWIVNNMKRERFLQQQQQQQHTQHQQHQQHAHPHQDSCDQLLREEEHADDVVLSMDPTTTVGGGSFSVLQHNLVNELLLERGRQRSEWSEALRLLVPSSRKGWVLFFVFVVFLALLVSVSQFREDNKQGKGLLMLRETFWWGVLASSGQHQQLQLSEHAVCETTVAGPAGQVVDSAGLKCLVEEVAANGCCFGGFAPATSPTNPCIGCASGCCGSFLDCVSCCLGPDRMVVLRYQLFALSNRGFPGVDISAFNPFQLCQALCRTSSSSLDSHGKFLNEEQRNCYLISDKRASV